MAIAKDGYDRQEHDGNANAKNVSIVKSAATLYAVVNTGAVGVGQSLVTVLNPVAIAGNLTIDSGNIAVSSAPTLFAVVNTSAGGGNVTLDPGSVTGIRGNLTIDSGNIAVTSNTAWADPNTYIGLATIDIGSAPTLTVDATSSGDVPITLAGEQVSATISGNVTIDSGTVSVNSNTAWSDPNTYIGLATVDIGSAPTLVVDATGQGDVPITLDGESVTATIVGNVTVDQVDTVTTVTAVTDITNPVALKGNITLDAGSKVAIVGNVTIDSIQPFSYAFTSGPTTDWIVKDSAGTIHAIHVGAAVASSVIEISDHASDGDGNVQLYWAGDTIGPATYPLDVAFGTGITLDVTNQTHVTVIYR